MRYYLAPMEGITGYLFRQTLAEVFGPPDKCFTPFVSPNGNQAMTRREREDVVPEHNQGLSVVPQILANRGEHFLLAARELAQMGYREVNLNLGCPSGTVVAKGKGSGFLASPRELDHFLEEIFEKAPLGISIKTRLGVEEPEEFPAILDIFNKYPVKELIIHPRVQKDFYKNKPRREQFGHAMAHSSHMLCYNGDLFTEADTRGFLQEFPGCGCLMLGRGVLANPALLRMLAGGEALKREELYRFQELLAERYYQRMADDRNVMFKMKELWFYLIKSFSGGEKYVRKLKKVQRLGEYRLLMEQLFGECPICLPKQLYF